MAKRVVSRVRSPRKRSSEFSSVSDGGMFESRPFVVQSKVGKEGEKSIQQTSDLKTQLSGATRFGHNLSQMPTVQVSDGGMFESHPFVVQSKVGEEGEKLGFKTSLNMAERYEHPVSQIYSPRASAATVVQLNTGDNNNTKQEDKEDSVASTSTSQSCHTAKEQNKTNSRVSIFCQPNISSNVMQRLNVKDLVNLSKVHENIKPIAEKLLFDSHARFYDYNHNKESKGKDKEEAKQLFQKAKNAVNIAYRLLMEHLSGKEGLNYEEYGISKARWEHFIETMTTYKKLIQSDKKSNKAMSPSAVTGYIIEDIATHFLKQWFIKNNNDKKTDECQNADLGYQLNFQDNEILNRKSRPDITTITNKNKEQVLMDITADSSVGHILNKQADWLRHPHVAEILYPSINFTNPNNLKSKLSQEERQVVYERIKQKQIDNQINKYKIYLRKREKYYKSINSKIDGYFKSLNQVSELKKNRYNNNINTNLTLNFDEHEIKRQKMDSNEPSQKSFKLISVQVASFSSTNQEVDFDTAIYLPIERETYVATENDQVIEPTQLIDLKVFEEKTKAHFNRPSNS